MYICKPFKRLPNNDRFVNTLINQGVNQKGIIMVLLEFTMSPTGKGESLSPYVSRVLKKIDDSGITYQLTPMSTILEGEWDEVMDVVRDCFFELKQDCPRIGVHLKVDYREGSQSRMSSKIESLEKKIGKKLNR